MKHALTPPIPYGTWCEVNSTGIQGRVMGWLPMSNQIYLDSDFHPWNTPHLYAPDELRVLQRPYHPNPLTCSPPEPPEPDDQEYPDDIPF